MAADHTETYKSTSCATLSLPSLDVVRTKSILHQSAICEAKSPISAPSMSSFPVLFQPDIEMKADVKEITDYLLTFSCLEVVMLQSVTALV